MKRAAPNVVKLGTRGSRLALCQAELVTSRLAGLHPGAEIRRVIVKTVGDKILDTPLSQIGDKGLFTKELDIALRSGEIDLAVHSLKDLPTFVPEDLALGAVLEREDPGDVLISASGLTLAQLPSGARVGTSSLRRRSQLLALRPDLDVVSLRGNVPTRIEKVLRGEFDAIVLARAGLTRLGLIAKATEVLGAERMLPAVGQGAIGVEIRAADPRIAAMVSGLDHTPTRLAVTAERSLLRRLEGGCQVPIGALAISTGDRLELQGLVADLQGSPILRASEVGRALSEPDAAGIGERLAQRLLDMGARAILDRIVLTTRHLPLPSPSGGGEGD